MLNRYNILYPLARAPLLHCCLRTLPTLDIRDESGDEVAILADVNSEPQN
ncbi:MAG: hypothetical protein K0A89_02305 [ANME-2 cluster archaeon]|nr:hypothetical protein [ANME-2 cluster archaeon]